MLLSVLMNGGVNLVAVDVRAGNVLWKEPLDLSFVEHILYLAYANGTLVVTGTKNRDGYAWYYLFGHDAATGDLKWSADHHNPTADAGGVHGEQVHHPVIAGNTIFAEPVAYNLQTGERVNPSGEGADWTLSSRHGCGTISGSASCLFFRDSNPSIHDTRGSGARAKITAISRPGCWINIIPAGGLVMIPEASSGCTCAFPVQTSMAFLSTATP